MEYFDFRRRTRIILRGATGPLSGKITSRQATAMNKTRIDIPARRATAAIYRHFAAGITTNYTMEDSLPESREPGLHEIFYHGVWPVYDDMHEHKLTGDYRLTPEGRRYMARIVLFLHSDLPYRWPRTTGPVLFVYLLLSIVSVGTFPLFVRLWKRFDPPAKEPQGDYGVWPFFTRTEYKAALHNPPFLRGTKASHGGLREDRRTA